VRAANSTSQIAQLLSARRTKDAGQGPEDERGEVAAEVQHHGSGRAHLHDGDEGGDGPEDGHPRRVKRASSEHSLNSAWASRHGLRYHPLDTPTPELPR
jgi:hypothetical protein